MYATPGQKVMLGRGIDIEMVGTCHSTNENGTQKSILMIEIVDPRIQKCRLQSGKCNRFLKEISEIDPQNYSVFEIRSSIVRFSQMTPKI